MNVTLWRRCAMSEVTTRDWTLEEDISGYARSGWHGIGIWLYKLERSHGRYDTLPVNRFDLAVVDTARHAIEQAGLRVSSLIAAGDYIYADEEERRYHVDHTRFSIEVAYRIGTDVLCICPGPLRGLPRKSAINLVCKSLYEVLPIAEIRGVKLAIEPLKPCYTDFINTIDQAMELVEHINHPLVGVYLDTYQLWGTNIFQGIEQASSRIFAVHLADSPGVPQSTEDRLIPGEGVIPIRDIVQAIEDTGYLGWYEIELMSTKLWQSDYDELLHRCATAMKLLL
jgi:sugar phosphate isomerase/epimerase